MSQNTELERGPRYAQYSEKRGTIVCTVLYVQYMNVHLSNIDMGKKAERHFISRLTLLLKVKQPLEVS